MSTKSQQTLDSKLNKWKANLIDLSKRNRLLNFSDHSASVIQLDEDMETLFSELVSDNKFQVNSIVDMNKFILKEQRRKKRKIDEPKTYDDEIQLWEESTDEDEVDRAYQKLEKQLNAIRLKAKTYIDEKGINTLYIAFGFLKWKESKDSSIFLKSPLVLVPVSLKRENVNEPYWLEKYADEVIINPTLLQKLKIDFGITPNFNQEEGENTLLEVIEQFFSEIKNYQDWQILHESALSLFSFSKLVMYKDFEQYYDELKQHELIQRLAGIEAVKNFSENDTQIDIREHDRKSRSIDSFQILDADSSQQEAILAVQRGKSFIISGPPGTGKSQTITNIISESLAKGKRVLFVSEKKAALEVVKKRLDDQQLGDFCLELHSNNANKKYVLNELYRTYGLHQSPSLSPISFDSFDRNKSKLNEYVDALHMTLEPLQWSPHYVHGLLAKLHEVDELTFGIENIQKVDRNLLEEINELIKKMETYSHVLYSHDRHIWKGALPNRFTLELEGNISANFRKLANGLEDVKYKIEEILYLVGGNWEVTPEVVDRIKNLSTTLNHIPRIPKYWLQDDDSFDTSREIYHQMKETFLNFESRKNQILVDFEEGAANLDLHLIEYTLTSKFLQELQGLVKDTESFINQIVVSASEQLNVVRRMKKEIDVLLSTQEFAREVFGISFTQVTVETMRLYVTISQHILTNPSPTAKWFERANHDNLLEELQNAQNKYEEYIKDRLDFESKYDLDVLDELDVKNMLQRFMNDYTGFLRILKRNFREDRKKLKFFKKDKGKISYDELTKDLREAVKLLEKKSKLAEIEPDLKNSFGKIFQGERTDWNQLRQNMKSVFDLVSLLEVASFPKKEIEKLMLEMNSYQLERVNTKFKETTDALSLLKNKMGSIVDYMLVENVFEQTDEDLLILSNKLLRVSHIAEEISSSVEELLSFSKKDRWKNQKEIFDDIQSLKEFNEQKLIIENEMSKYQKLFGSLFDGYETDWNEIYSALQWTQKLFDIFNGKVSEQTISLIFNESRDMQTQFIKTVEELSSLWNDTARERNFFFTIFPREGELFKGEVFYHAKLTEIIEYLHRWIDQSFRLEEWIAFQNILHDSYQLGIVEFVHEIMALKHKNLDIHHLFLKRFYRIWLDYAYQLLPSLSNFYFDQHQRLIDDFRNIDMEQIKQNGPRLHHMLMNNKKMFINSFNGRQHNEVFTLNREVQKQKRHKPIRRLFSEMPNLLMALKPCMMMSPMSVSQFIDPKILKFDVVIFDEASQICSEDAIGSILRGKQIIIAGDNKQLPPTRFFGSVGEESEEFIDEDDASNEIYESVLDEAAVFMPIVPLKWHYRSKHESLIAFSNREIYNNELYTFPSSSSGKNDGVSLVHVAEGIYDRGGSKKNRIEAMVVAKQIFEHFRSSKRSLGVIAFSEAQQEAIRDYVDELRKKHPEYEKYFSEENSEPFFIKNLENVQGDERDTIIFSVGYGKDSSGNLHYNFGPLNKPGGERRLNVAITRAKYEVKIVSSILHTDLDDQKLTKRGPQLLKNYLYYASTGGKFNPNSGTSYLFAFDSPLEEDVYDALTARGLYLHKQVGCSSYRIDLAVVDPNIPGRYLLGIECDGAAYHSSKTARDRDRLRQQVLESLGWKIHRIWSQDWFKRKRQEIDKIIEVIRQINATN